MVTRLLGAFNQYTDVRGNLWFILNKSKERSGLLNNKIPMTKASGSCILVEYYHVTLIHNYVTCYSVLMNHYSVLN